ncbi:toxic anion resistance protein [Roseitranquillus sediminis]|uniref:toxic anion resistance protein n=1 Tax=Roseitranquillus sediminis TaxID=2809051 RepID=UPI001D0BF786|nr:toxic anion resistance protein [Roseitranquillus sediminis]MBM9594793.1 toxic anion resistance protein [Roseitranquillus sediminis]
MSEKTRSQAAATSAEVDAVTGHELAPPAPDLPRLDDAPTATRSEIEMRLAELDMTDTGSIVAFGSRAQQELQSISQSMLADVRNKDVGPAGDSLREIVATLRGFSLEELDPNRRRSWWERLVGRAKPMAKFLAKYEEVQGQIDGITDRLLRHEHQLLKDINSLDLLYDRTLDFYNELGLYIAAGEEKLRRLDAEEIPSKEREMSDGQGDDVIEAQGLRDLRAARDDLERRVHDLRLTRQVTMQSLPSIRLVQENDKSLVTKINSTLVNTVPLWETQLAQAVTINRSRQAAGAVREATDLTNDLLRANAENLRQSNKEIRQQIERGVFDVEAVKAANDNLIGTIQETLQIADEAKARRSAAEAELRQMETELKSTLAAARASRPVT